MTKFEPVSSAGERLAVSALKPGDWVPSWGTVIKLASGSAAGLFGPDTSRRSPDSLEWVSGDKPIPVSAQVKVITMDSFAGVTREGAQTAFKVKSTAGYVGDFTVEGYKDEFDIRIDVPGKVTVWVDPEQLVTAVELARTVYQP